MGQSSISMLNKVGYSMYWNSMWDNKVLYSRNLKEDIFFNKFFYLIFNDNVSANTVNLKRKTYNYLFYYKIEIDEKKNSLYKYLINNNKIKFTQSKIWILKYQKWIILYKFVYINYFERNSKPKSFLNYGSSFFYCFKFYKKALKKTKSNFLLYKKHVNQFSF